MHTYKLITVLSLAILLFGGQVFAQADVSAEETVSLQDLQAGDPQILPSSPFYFFKELTRSVQRVFTFDSVKKVELELKITNEKAAETKKTQDTQGQNSEALQKAVENYQKAQEALKARLESLKETSQNPNIDKLLDKVAERVIKHEKLFDELAAKTDKEEVRVAIKKAKERAEEATGEAIKRDEVAKFVARLEKALVEGKGGELKHIRSLEIIDRIAEKAPENAKQSLGRLREDFSSLAQENIKDVLKKGTSESLMNALGALPGDKARRSVLLEELQSKAWIDEDEKAPVLKEISEKLGEFSPKEGENIAERAEGQIKRAREIIQKIENAVGADSSAVSFAAVLKQAKGHLDRAVAAFADQKYGEAFGQARSAEVIARNALGRFEEDRTPDSEDTKEHLEELAAKISRYEKLLTAKTLRPNLQEKAQSLLSLAKEHLGFARDAFTKEDFITAKTHIGHVKGYLRDLVRLLEHAKRPEPETLPESGSGTGNPEPCANTRTPAEPAQ